MKKQTYFLTKKQISSIMRNYGGGHRWSFRTEMSEHNVMIFMDSMEYMLSVNLMLEGNEKQFPYIEVRITGNSGIIVRKDRYEYIDTDMNQFEFIYTEEYGTFYNEFRPLIKPSAAAKQKKQTNTQKLEQQLTEVKKMLEFYEGRIKTLQLQAEQGFLNSPTYHQMQEEIDFYKSMNKLNDIHLANAEEKIHHLQLMIGETQVSPAITSLNNTNEIIEHGIIERPKSNTMTKKAGRPPVVDSQKVNLVIKLRKEGKSIRNIAEQLHMSVGNVHRYIKLYERELSEKE